MRPLRALVLSAVVVLAPGCASAPKAPPHMVLSLLAGVPSGVESREPSPPIRAEDARGVTDRTVIGEVLAPGGGAPPVTGIPVATAVVMGAAMMAPSPTGRYLLVKDAAEVVQAVSQALNAGLLQSKRHFPETALLQATVRTFWMRPSWRTTCDVAVEVRLLDAAGRVPWERTLESHVDRFEGLFTVEAFERVARMALEQLTEKAAGAFAADDFAAAAARTQ